MLTPACEMFRNGAEYVVGVVVDLTADTSDVSPSRPVSHSDHEA
jgi:hypothetical protein